MAIILCFWETELNGTWFQQHLSSFWCSKRILPLSRGDTNNWGYRQNRKTKTFGGKQENLSLSTILNTGRPSLHVPSSCLHKSACILFKQLFLDRRVLRFLCHGQFTNITNLYLPKLLSWSSTTSPCPSTSTIWQSLILVEREISMMPIDYAFLW